MGLAVNSIVDEGEKAIKIGNNISPPHWASPLDLPFLTCSDHDHLRAALPPPAVASQWYRVSISKNHRLGGLSQFPSHGSMTVDNCRADHVAAEQNQSSALVYVMNLMCQFLALERIQAIDAITHLLILPAGLWLVIWICHSWQAAFRITLALLFFLRRLKIDTVKWRNRCVTHDSLIRSNESAQNGADEWRLIRAKSVNTNWISRDCGEMKPQTF